MNRKLAAWTIAAVAVLGLTACSGSPSASEEGSKDTTSSEAPAENTAEQSVADACAVAIAEVGDAGTALSSLDLEAASADPQGTVDTFTETVDAIGAAADSVTNVEVKEAMTALHGNYADLRDLLSAVLIDQDMTVTEQMSTVTTELTESATALTTLCAG